MGYFGLRCRRMDTRLILLSLLATVLLLYFVVHTEMSPGQRVGHEGVDGALVSAKYHREIDDQFQKELNAQIAACVSNHVISDVTSVTDSSSSSKMVRCLEHVVQTARRMPDLVSSFLAEPVKYPYSYHFVLNQVRICSGRSELEVLMVIPSAPHFSKRRQDVRESNRGKYMKDPANKSVLLFFLGLPDNKTHPGLQHEIQAEADLYGDIVQSDFLDAYKNIRLKAVSMLKWASTFCPNADYVIRTDDDVNVTVTDLVNVMRAKKKDYTDFVIGRRKVGDVPARSNNKWHLSKEEYPHPTFPPYVLGGLIGYPLSTVKLLYEATLRYPPIWLDDVYVTGLCTQRLGIPVLADDKFDFAHRLKPGDFGPGVKIP